MKQWLLLALLASFTFVPSPTNAQGQVILGNVTVQFWPEYDQPSMLVIYDFTLNENVSLPAEVALRVPIDANIIAVAYDQGGQLLNYPSQEPVVEGDWQVLRLTLEELTTYHIEYYAPLSFSGDERSYEYVWAGDYAVDRMVVRLQIPVDTREVVTTPDMPNVSQEAGLSYRLWSQDSLEAGEQFPVTIRYTKSSDRLTVSAQPAQPVPVGEDASGRISLNTYLPYIVGGFGLVLILAGGYYFWQSGRGVSKPRRRYRPYVAKEQDDGNVYCHQCGKRAQSNDRFCRTCGTRLRKDE